MVGSWQIPGGRAVPTAVPSRAAPSQMHQFARQGVVKSWNGAKGFGFISADGFDGDVMFARQELPEDHREVRGKFLEGKPVTFQAQSGPDGRMKVTTMEVMLTEGQQIAGVIKSHSERHGYGFIASSSLSQDVRFESSDIGGLSFGAKLQGELVVFEMNVLPDGKMRASKILFQSGKIATRMKSNTTGATVGVGGKGRGNGFGNGGSVGGFDDDGTATGFVKSYSEKNGYGFVNVPGIPFDIKFGQSDLLIDTVKNGQVVRFAMALGPDGRPQAKQVHLDASSADGRGQKRHAVMAGMGASMGGGLAAMKQLRTDTNTGMQKRGVIKSYNSTKGFGFVSTQGVAGDVFFMRTALPEALRETHGKELSGQKVAFEVLQSSDGQMRAGSMVLG